MNYNSSSRLIHFDSGDGIWNQISRYFLCLMVFIMPFHWKTVWKFQNVCKIQWIVCYNPCVGNTNWSHNLIRSISLPIDSKPDTDTDAERYFRWAKIQIMSSLNKLCFNLDNYYKWLYSISCGFCTSGRPFIIISINFSCHFLSISYSLLESIR